MTKTPLEENNSDEWMVAVTTQESLDGILEKAMRIVSLHKMGTCCSARRGHSPEGAEIDKTKKAKEIVRPYTKSKLWKDVGLRRAMQNWNMKYVDNLRSPESALREFITSE